jgi:hypothetical protein
MKKPVGREEEAKDFLLIQRIKKARKKIEKYEIHGQRNQKKPQRPEFQTGKNAEEVDEKSGEKEKPRELNRSLYIVVELENPVAILLVFIFKEADERDFGKRA